jgi:hypothetical protein
MRYRKARIRYYRLETEIQRTIQTMSHSARPLHAERAFALPVHARRPRPNRIWALSEASGPTECPVSQIIQ